MEALLRLLSCRTLLPSGCFRQGRLFLIWTATLCFSWTCTDLHLKNSATVEGKWDAGVGILPKDTDLRSIILMPRSWDGTVLLPTIVCVMLMRVFLFNICRDSVFVNL